MAFYEDPEETTEASEEVPPEQADAPDAPDKSAAIASDVPVEPAPAKSKTAMIVVVAAVVLLAVAAVFFFLPKAGTKGGAVAGDATQNKARIQAAIGVMEALRIYDLKMLKPLLSDGAQSSITAEQWTTAIEASTLPSATFSPAMWTGDTTAAVTYDIEGTTGTMFFAPSLEKPNVVTMSETSVDGDLMYDVELVAAGTGWRVLSLTPKAETFLLDAEFVRSLVDTSTP